MKAKPKVMEDGGTVTVRVPISIRSRGGRKLVLAPDGANVRAAPVTRHIDSAMVKALARAYRWQRLIESGTYTSIAEIARAERINDSYVSRLMRLTLLAPEIVEAILDGRESPRLQIDTLLKPMPVEWERQRAHISPPPDAECLIRRPHQLGLG